MSPKIIVGICASVFAVGIVMVYILTEPSDDLHATNFILGTNGDSDVLILTSQSTAVLPDRVDNVTDLWGITPVEFLKALKMERSSSDEYLFREPIRNWISRKDLPALLALANSREPCASIALKASPAGTLQSSTLGQQALFMLDGYRKGVYPPALNSRGYNAAQAKELTDWCRDQLENMPRD